MRCGGCGTENRDAAKFCGECGTRLERRCGGCDAPLADGLKFCDECGTPTSSSDVMAAVEPSGAARKSVTVAFVDLGGSTAFGETVDAETARSVMGRYHSLVTEAVETHAGTVAKYIGDGVMVLFGVPEIAEDDANRAVAFGADVQERFAPFAERVRARHGVTVTLRVGVNTGEIVIGEDDVDLYGDALNVAARLEKACPHGRVLVGEETWRLARSDFAFEPQGEVEVHGRTGAVRPYLLVLDAEVEERTAPFVGRDDELGRLERLFTRVAGDRRPALASVVGPPGVGKTRLSRELQELVAAHDATVYTTTCDRDGDATLGPIADLLRPDDVTDPDTVRAGLVEVLDGDPDTDRIVEGLLAVLGSASKKVSVEETFWSVRRLVEHLGRNGPVVVVVDDIQWASEQLLDLFEHLVSFVDETALLLVTLARPEIRDLRPVFAESGRPVDELVLLAGLDADATATLAARLLGTDELPRGLAERLPASTDGNPLFVREVVRMLVDEQVIRAEGERWVLTVEPDAIDVPPTIQSLLAARVERLPPDERVLLERAAVIGPDFTRGGLEHLCNPVERTALPQLLRSLTRRELIEATGAYWGDDPIHRFHHVLIRDAVYRRLLKETRAELHERVGAWMVDASADVLGDHEAAIGHHFEQAFRYRDDLGDDGPTLRALGDRAAQLLSAAAAVALRDDDTVAAGGLARRALACLAVDAPARPSVLTLACEALLDVGDAHAARPFVDELLALAELSGAFAGWAKAYDAQTITVAEPDRLADAEALATEAVDAMAELDDPAGRAKARLVRAAILARRGRIGECEAELDVALTEARAAGDTRRVVAVLGVAPLAALWGPSPVARAGGRCLDVLRLLRITASSPSVEAVALRCQAVLEALRGRIDTALSLIDRAQASIEELGLRRELADTAMARGQIHLLAGDPTAAESPLRTAHESLIDLRAGAEASQAAALLGRALLRLDRADEVEELVDEAERLAGENLKAAILGRTVRAEWLLAIGRADEARAVAERAVAIAETTDLVLDHADAAEVLAAAGGVPATTANELRERKGVAAAAAPADGRSAVPPSPDVSGPTTHPPAEDTAPEPSEHTSVESVMTSTMRRLSAAWGSGDRDGFRSLFVDAPALDVARAVGADSADGADALETMWSLRDLMPGNDMRVDRVSERGVALGGVRFHDDGENEVEMRTVVEFDEHMLVERLTTFDGHDVAGATDLFERRVEERSDDPLDRYDFIVPELRRVLDGTPYATMLRHQVRSWSGEPALRALIFGRDDIELEDRRSVISLGSTTGPGTEAIANFAADYTTWAGAEVLALRGPRHGVVRVTFGDDHGNEYSVLAVDEVDRDGRIVRSTHVDPDAITEAVALLDEWFLESDESVGTEVVAVGSRILAAQHDPSRRDEVDRTLADDVVIRFADELTSWGEISREVYLGITDALTGEAERIDHWVVWGEALSACVAVWVGRRVAVMPDGISPEWSVAILGELREGQVRAIDVFPIEDLDRARAHARQVNALGAFGQTPATLADAPTVEWPEWNDAVRSRLKANHYLNGHDVGTEIHPDAVIEDHRPMNRTRAEGRTEIATFASALGETMQTSVDAGSSPQDPFRTCRVLAVDGDRRSLTADCGIGVADYLTVAEIDGSGAMVRHAYYAVEQLDEAFADFRTTTRESDLGITDPLDRIDVVVPELRRVMGGTPFGRMAEFLDAYDDADEETMAWFFSRDDLVNQNRMSTLNSGQSTGAGVLEILLATNQFLPTVKSNEVLAVRGTRFGVGRTSFGDDDGNRYDFLSVQEVDDEGRLVRQVILDDDAVTEAVAILDDWYLEADDAIGREVGSVGVGVLATSHDPSRRDELLRFLPDDVVVRFAEELASWGEVSRDELLAITDTLTAEADRIDYWGVWSEPLSETVSCNVIRRVAEMPDGTTPEWVFAVTSVVRDGQVRQLDLFPVEDLDRARAHARELNGRGAFGELPDALVGESFVEPPEWNGAVRRRLRISASFNDRDFDASLRQFREDARISDRRPLLRNDYVGRDGILAYGASLLQTTDEQVGAGAIPDDPFRIAGVLAVAGDHVALTAEFVGGLADILVLFEVDDAGLVRRTAIFEVEQLDEARAMLAEWHTTSSAAPSDDPFDRVDFVVPGLRAAIEDTPIGRGLAAFIRSWDAGPDQVTWYFGRDGVVFDSRQSTVNSGINVGDDAVALGLVTHELFPIVASCEIVAIRGLRLGAVRYTLADEGGNRYAFISVNEVGDDGRVVRVVSFDDGAITAAVELLDGLYLASDEDVDRESSRVGATLLAASHDPARRDVLLDLVAEDVVWDFDIRPLGALGEVDRDGYLAILDSLTAEADHIDLWAVTSEPLDDGVSVAVVRRVAAIPDGTSVEWTFATATQVRDGRIQRGYVAEVEDLDRARAIAAGFVAESLTVTPGEDADRLVTDIPRGAHGERPHELAHVPDLPPAHVNTSLRTAQKIGAHVGDIDATLACFAEDIRMEDRSRLARLTVNGHDELREFFEATWTLIDEAKDIGRSGGLQSIGLLAVAGERMHLSHVAVIGVVDFVALVEVDDDGHIVHQVLFEVDDVDLAIEAIHDRADELALEVIGPARGGSR